MSIELNIGVKYKRVKWSVSETLTIVKNYNLKKYKDMGLSLHSDKVRRKAQNMKLPLIKRKSNKMQRKINNKIYNYVVVICNHYNKNRRLNMNYINKINKKHLIVVKNCFPKMCFDRMVRETKVLNFMEENKRSPFLKSKDKTERRIAQFLNNQQYSKKDEMFLDAVELMKAKNGIKSKLGEKKPKADVTMKQLIRFIKKNKRMPIRSGALDKEELRLASYFGNTCLPTGSNPNPELVKPHLNLFLKYMEHPSYTKTKRFFENVEVGCLVWEKGAKIKRLGFAPAIGHEDVV